MGGCSHAAPLLVLVRCGCSALQYWIINDNLHNNILIFDTSHALCNVQVSEGDGDCLLGMWMCPVLSGRYVPTVRTLKCRYLSTKPYDVSAFRRNVLTPSPVDGGGSRFNQKAVMYLPEWKASHPSRQKSHPFNENFSNVSVMHVRQCISSVFTNNSPVTPVMGAKFDIRSTNSTVSAEHRGWVIFHSYFVFRSSRFQFYVQRFRKAHPERLTVVFSRHQSVQENCLLPFIFMSSRFQHEHLRLWFSTFCILDLTGVWSKGP
jgi:hypothetical protein